MLVAIGQRFGRLVVKAEAEKSKSGKTRVTCVCDCGKETTTYQQSLRNGETASCGCRHVDKVKAMISARWASRKRGKSKAYSTSDDWDDLR